MVEKRPVTGMRRSSRQGWQLVAVAGVVVLTAAGCRGNNDNVAVASAGSPAATFATPPQVTGTTIKVSLSSSDIAIKPANGDASGHSGHYVLFVDQDPPAPGTLIPANKAAEGIIHTAASGVTLRGEDPGSHRLTVALADGTNARLGDAKDTATAVVSPPGLGMSVDQSAPGCQGALVTVTPTGFSLPVVASDMATLSAKGDVTVPGTTTTSTVPSVTDGVSPALATTTTAAPVVAGAPTTTAGPTTTAPPPSPAQVSYFLDRPPASGPAASIDVGVLTTVALSVCVTGLPSGAHTVWAVTVDSAGAPLITPIESKFSFTVS